MALNNRVVIVLPYLTRYRVGFLAKVRDILQGSGVELKILAGDPAGTLRDRRDDVQDRMTEHYDAMRIAACGKAIQVRRLHAVGPQQANLVIMDQATSNLDAYALLMMRQFGKAKTALWGHGLTITQPTSAVSSMAQAWMLRRADWFFAYTEGSAERALAAGMSAERISVLNNTFDTSGIQAAREQMALTHHKEQAPIDGSPTQWCGLVLGALDSTKRIPFVLAAAKRIHQSDRNFILLVAGDGPDRHLVESAGPWVRYLGPAGDREKAQLSRDAQMILNPGRIGLVAIDSFAMGLPIIYTPWPYHAPEREYLNASNSMMVGDSPDELANAALWLRANSDERSRLSASCSASMEKFSLDNMVQSFCGGVLACLSSEPRKTK